MRLVIALGGNALSPTGRAEDAAAQRRRIADAASALAELAREHELVITHGNGPQIGLLATQARASGGAALPLDVLGAESEGMIGYWIESELASILPEREVATLLTQVEVDPDDPAFGQPSKPIGPVVAAAESEALEEAGVTMKAVAGGFRRVVASPRPLRIREERVITRLLDAGVLVICAGGGGIPVTRTRDGGLRGVEAVIDKDLTAAMLAERVEADELLLLTNVPGVYADWDAAEGTGRRVIERAHPDALDELRFEAGSMGPKVEAAATFARRTGGTARIGALEDARCVLEGRAGTGISTAAEGLTMRAVA